MVSYLKEGMWLKVSIKISFYTEGENKENANLDTKKRNIFEIQASEVCSEFIARYFQKVKEMQGIYKVDISKMKEDSNGAFEFKTFKECKTVREDLLNKYNKLEGNYKKIELYALLDV